MIKNKRWKIFSWFTLVELIIVITILAILATIAFISFQNYTKESKNTSKISTLKTIETGLQLYETKVWKYPHPDGEIVTGKLWENTLTYLGYVKENLSHTLRFPKVVKDVTFDAYYPYGVSHTYDEYQVWAVLEWGQVYQNILPTSYAGSYYTKVNGQYKWYLLYMSWWTVMIANIPSLLYSISWATLPPEDYQLDSEETYYIINNGKNLPYAPNWYTETQNKTLWEILQEKTWKTDAEFVNIPLETIKTTASSWQLSGFWVETLEQFNALIDGESPSAQSTSSSSTSSSSGGGWTSTWEIYYDIAGIYSFTIPSWVTHISAVCVWAGWAWWLQVWGWWGGGWLVYVNNVSVIPWNTLNIIIWSWWVATSSAWQSWWNSQIVELWIIWKWWGWWWSSTSYSNGWVWWTYEWWIWFIWWDGGDGNGSSGSAWWGWWAAWFEGKWGKWSNGNAWGYISSTWALQSNSWWAGWARWNPYDTPAAPGGWWGWWVDLLNPKSWFAYALAFKWWVWWKSLNSPEYDWESSVSGILKWWKWWKVWGWWGWWYKYWWANNPAWNWSDGGCRIIRPWDTRQFPFTNTNTY